MRIILDDDNFQVLDESFESVVISFCPICGFCIRDEIDVRSLSDVNCCADCEIDVIGSRRQERKQNTLLISAVELEAAKMNRKKTKYR